MEGSERSLPEVGGGPRGSWSRSCLPSQPQRGLWSAPRVQGPGKNGQPLDVRAQGACWSVQTAALSTGCHRHCILFPRPLGSRLKLWPRRPSPLPAPRGLGPLPSFPWERAWRVAHRTIQGHPASGSGLQGGAAQRVPKEGVQEAGSPVQGLAGPAWCRRTPARARSPSRSLKYLRSGAGRGLRQEPSSRNASGVFWPRGRLSLPGGRGSFGS